MEEETSKDRMDNLNGKLNPQVEGEPYNGTDPISPERAMNLIYQIAESVHELVEGIENVEKNKSGFPNKSEDVVAVYLSAQLQNFLGKNVVKGIMQGDLTLPLLVDINTLATTSTINENSGSTDSLPSIADHYDENPKHFTRIVREYYQLDNKQ